MRSLPGYPRDEKQEGKGERKAPDTCGDRADVGQPHHPWSKRERDIAKEQCREGEAMGSGSVSHPEGLESQAFRRKPERVSKR